MTNIDMVSERYLSDAELKLVAVGTRGGETNNSYSYSETVSTPRGNIFEVGNSGSSIGETYSNKAQ